MLRAVIALGLVGLMLIAFAFQAIGDGKTGNAFESGFAGLVLLGASYVLAKRTVLREPVRRRRRVSDLLD